MGRAMAISFKCPKCSHGLTVADELARTPVRCPGCTATVTVPGALTARPPVSAPDADEEDEDFPPSHRTRRRPPRDDEDDSRRPRRRSRRDEVEDEENDLDIRRRPSRRAMGAWARVGTGLLLVFLATWIYVVALAMLAVGFLEVVTAGDQPGRKNDLAATTPFVIGGLCLLLSWIFSLIGYGMGIGAPGRNGESGLAISALCVGALVVLLALVLLIQVADLSEARRRPRGFDDPWGQPKRQTESIVPVSLMLSLAEPGRLAVFAFFVWAVGKSLRQPRVATSGLVLGVALPCFGIATLLLQTVVGGMSNTNQEAGWLAPVVVLFEVVLAAGMMVWYAVVVWSARKAVEQYLYEAED